MEGETGVGTFSYLKLFVENFSIWPVIAAIILIWLARQPELLARLTKVSFAGFELELEQLKAQVAEGQEQINILENDLARAERLRFEDLLEGFDAHAPVEELARTRELLKSNADAMTDLSALSDYLGEGVSAGELYAAAVTLRERKPTDLVPDILDCLDRLAGQDDLGGIRLNTVWTLTSALHRILIVAIRDGKQPAIPTGELQRAQAVLDRLEANPRVQDDRPDAPDKGVRGPIRHARTWIDRGLADRA